MHGHKDGCCRKPLKIVLARELRECGYPGSEECAALGRRRPRARQPDLQQRTQSRLAAAAEMGQFQTHLRQQSLGDSTWAT